MLGSTIDSNVASGIELDVQEELLRAEDAEPERQEMNVGLFSARQAVGDEAVNAANGPEASNLERELVHEAEPLMSKLAADTSGEKVSLRHIGDGDFLALKRSPDLTEMPDSVKRARFDMSENYDATRNGLILSEIAPTPSAVALGKRRVEEEGEDTSPVTKLHTFVGETVVPLEDASDSDDDSGFEIPQLKMIGDDGDGGDEDMSESE